MMPRLQRSSAPSSAIRAASSHSRPCSGSSSIPAAVADVAVLAGTHLREQRLRPHLEVEADVLHQSLGMELLDDVIGQRTGTECHRDAALVDLLDEARQLQEALAFLPGIG